MVVEVDDVVLVGMDVDNFVLVVVGSADVISVDGVVLVEAVVNGVVLVDVRVGEIVVVSTILVLLLLVIELLETYTLDSVDVSTLCTELSGVCPRYI